MIHTKHYWLGPITIVTPKTIHPLYYIEINHSKIQQLAAKPLDESRVLPFNFQDYYCFPGLINAHDHLQGTYWPRVGQNRPYISFYPWILDLMNSETLIERRKINNLDLFLLGAYRNLITGVTTVQDHYPHQALPKWKQGGNDIYLDKLPIRVPPEYTIAHEVHEQENQWGMGPELEHQWAMERNWPFITHLEEGFTEECMKGIDYLKEMKALSDHTVLIHCLGLSNQDIKDMAAAGTHMVTCPFSNFYMFNLTARLKEIMDAGVNVSLGTDSPASGSLNLLEEMKFLKKIYFEHNQEEIEDHVIVDMVTENPALALRINQKLGTIAPGYLADFLIIPQKYDSPYKTLVEAKQNDIALVIKEGIPLYGKTDWYDWFEACDAEYTKIHLDRTDRIIIGDPREMLRRIRKAIGFNKKFPFLPIT